jgi:hypothetical protein
LLAIFASAPCLSMLCAHCPSTCLQLLTLIVLWALIRTTILLRLQLIGIQPFELVWCALLLSSCSHHGSLAAALRCLSVPPLHPPSWLDHISCAKSFPPYPPTPSQCCRVDCVQSTFNTGAASLRYAQHTSISCQRLCAGCWHLVPYTFAALAEGTCSHRLLEAFIAQI